MTTRATEKRLAALEVTRRGPVNTVHCVQVGDNPPLKVDGSECHLHHDRVFVIGGTPYGDIGDK